MARSLIEERYTWPVRTVLLGGGSLRATSYQILRLIYCAGGTAVHIRPISRYLDPRCASKLVESVLALPLGSRRSLKSDRLLGTPGRAMCAAGPTGLPRIGR